MTRSTASRIRRSLALLVVSVVVLAVLVVGGVAVAVWYVARQDDRSTADAIVVLGAAQYDGVPTPVFQARLEHAAELYTEGVAPRIVTVGGNQPGDTYTEAGAGRAYLTELGVPPESLLAVETGSNTERSIDAVAQTVTDLGGDSVVLVSDPTHSLRADLMAEDAGLRARTSPTRHGPAVWTRENQLTNIVRETGAVLYYEWTRLSGGGAELPH